MLVKWIPMCLPNFKAIRAFNITSYKPVLQHIYTLAYVPPSWWGHQLETFSALLAIFAGNSPVNSPHKGQRRGALMFSLICVSNGWVNNREAGDLRRYRAHYDVIVMVEAKFTKVTEVSALIIIILPSKKASFEQKTPPIYSHLWNISFCL